MINRHYQRPHRLTCITDDPAGIDPTIRIIPLWDTFSQIQNPYGAHAPSCYRRLRLFAPDACDLIGPRFVCIDLDTVIVGDVRPLWDRSEDIVLYDDPLYHGKQYCGSMLMMTAGARPQVWNDFDPNASPRLAMAAGRRGSDQAWISYKIPGEATWGPQDGVYSYRRHILPKGGVLPPDARLTMWHGDHDPWDPAAQQLPWVTDNWGVA